jgi:hypothetical protein
LKEVAQRLPALTHSILEQIFLWYHRTHFVVMLPETSLAILFEVAFPKDVPELCKLVCQLEEIFDTS